MLLLRFTTSLHKISTARSAPLPQKLMILPLPCTLPRYLLHLGAAVACTEPPAICTSFPEVCNHGMSFTILQWHLWISSTISAQRNRAVGYIVDQHAQQHATDTQLLIKYPHLAIGTASNCGLGTVQNPGGLQQ